MEYLGKTIQKNEVWYVYIVRERCLSYTEVVNVGNKITYVLDISFSIKSL